tara:strand:- start:821 stop:1336 length:516 start_codon:yes stop_codon:yes gene_type:complete
MKLGEEITYKIDNFSGIIEVNKFISHYKSNNLHWRHPEKKPNFINTNLIGVYILYDENKKPIYIGKSSNCIRSRLLSHCSTTPKTYDDVENIFILYKRTKYKYFSYIVTKDNLNDFLECYLIKKYNPKYNRSINKLFKYDKDWDNFLEKNKTNKMIKADINYLEVMKTLYI